MLKWLSQQGEGVSSRGHPVQLLQSVLFVSRAWFLTQAGLRHRHFLKVTYNSLHLKVTNTLLYIKLIFTLLYLKVIYTLLYLKIIFTILYLKPTFTLLYINVTFTLLYFEVTSTLLYLQVTLTLLSSKITSTLLDLKVTYTLLYQKVTYTLLHQLGGSIAVLTTSRKNEVFVVPPSQGQSSAPKVTHHCTAASGKKLLKAVLQGILFRDFLLNNYLKTWLPVSNPELPFSLN